MAQLKRTVFRRCALASGLLTKEQFEQAELALRESADPATTETDETDVRLAAKLVEMGCLNPWQAEQLKLGRTKFNLGLYQVFAEIGQGGMGQVFKAEHTLLGRVAAIKVLPRHKSTPDAIARFTREMRAQATLDHENLVRAFDAGRDGNVYFLVTEYVAGTDLRKFVRSRGKLSMQEAATIVSQAAEGLAHAHSRGLIHRDVKPGNLIVTPTGQTKVLDLGLAALAGGNDEDDPNAGKIVGTADYLSPEQFLTPRSVTAASDVYSLGCTLYYTVTGKVPFPGGANRDKIRRHCEETPLNPKRFNADLSDSFIEVLEAMLEKDPAKRIATADEVVRRLKPWAGDAVRTTPEDEMQIGSSAASLTRPQIPDVADDTKSGFFDDVVTTTEESSQASSETSAFSRSQIERLRKRKSASEPAAKHAILLTLAFTPLVLASLSRYYSQSSREGFDEGLAA